MSSALKLEPRCPDPGALHRDERVQAADVREKREACVGLAVRGAYGVDVRLRDERELRHAGRR